MALRVKTDDKEHGFSRREHDESEFVAVRNDDEESLVIAEDMAVGGRAGLDSAV